MIRKGAREVGKKNLQFWGASVGKFFMINLRISRFGEENFPMEAFSVQDKQFQDKQLQAYSLLT